MNKKLIGFPDELMEKIEQYSDQKGMTFTEAVRNLIESGFTDNTQEQGDQIDFPSLVHMVEELQDKVKNMGFWNADDNISRTGNLEIQAEEFDKRINVLTSTAKLFKAHLKDRSIHLQD